MNEMPNEDANPTIALERWPFPSMAIHGTMDSAGFAKWYFFLIKEIAQGF